jgi:hypothetical protein
MDKGRKFIMKELEILTALGITREDVLDKAINYLVELPSDYRRVSEEDWISSPLYKSLDIRIDNEVNSMLKKMSVSINERLEKMMQEKIDETFNLPFQRTDCWGDPIGKKTSIREIIKERADSYLSEKVDNDGKNSDYGKFTRAELLARNIIENEFNAQIKCEIENIALQLKNRIPKTISEEISKVVLNYIK